MQAGQARNHKLLLMVHAVLYTANTWDRRNSRSLGQEKPIQVLSRPSLLGQWGVLEMFKGQRGVLRSFPYRHQCGVSSSLKV